MNIFQSRLKLVQITKKTGSGSDDALGNFIVGKATRIWYSEDKFTDKSRWDRIMKKIK